MERALNALRKPGARLVLLHTHETKTGNAFYIMPDGGHISDETALALLERNDVQPFDPGLLPGHWQSWALGDWRKPPTA